MKRCVVDSEEFPKVELRKQVDCDACDECEAGACEDVLLDVM